jgi:uncharacterized membrane protein
VPTALPAAPRRPFTLPRIVPVPARGRVPRHAVPVAALTLAFAAVFCAYGYLKYRAGREPGWDLAIFDEAVRSYAHFHLPRATVKSHASPTDPGTMLLGDHFSPLLAVLAPLYWIHASAADLVLAQGVLFALAVIPVWRFTRRRINPAAAYFAACVYALSWPLQEALDFDVHEVAFEPLLTAVLIERVDAGRWRHAAIAAGLLMLVKEDQGLVVCMTGLWIAKLGHRRIGARFAAAGFGGFLTVMYVAIPVLGGHSLRYWTFALGSTPRSALSFLIHHPAQSAAAFFTPADPKVETLFWLLAPTLFLAARSWIALLAAPLVVVRYLETQPAYWGRQDHYNAFLAAILVLAAVDGATKLKHRHAATAWSAAALAVTLAMLPHLPLKQLTEKSLRAVPEATRTAASVASHIPAGAYVVIPQNLEARLDGRLHPLADDALKVAPEWIMTPDLAAERAKLIGFYSTFMTVPQYTVVYRQGPWVIARAAD